MKTKSLFTALLIVVLAIAFAANKPDTAGAEPKGDAPTVAPLTGDDIIAEVKDIYVCKQNGMYLSDSDAAGALCPDGARVLKWVSRMISDGWERQEILDLVSSLQMGQPLMRKTGQPACDEPGRLKADFFIMSYCPFGVKYVTEVLMPMLTDMGDAVDFTPYFIMGKNADGTLSAMHGQKEVDENLRMICLREKWGMDKWLAYTACFAMDIYGNRNAPKDWKYCADKAEINVGELEACFKNDAVALADKDIEMSIKYRAQGSPTAVYNCSGMIVGAIPYQQIKKDLCRLDKDKKIAACQKDG